MLFNGKDRLYIDRNVYNIRQTEKIISGIKEVVYTNGSHSVLESTKEQKEFLEKISIEL